MTAKILLFLPKKAPVFAESSERPLEGIVVVIDAGHGGEDPGALGVARFQRADRERSELYFGLCLETGFGVAGRKRSYGLRGQRQTEF